MEKYVPGTHGAGNFYIQLGRFGDIVSLLPLMYEANRSGYRPTVVVAEEFRSMLESITYVNQLHYSGTHLDINGAQRKLIGKTGQGKLLVPQVYGNGLIVTRTGDNFQMDAWGKVGARNRWEQNNLVFDNRDFVEEALLVEKYIPKNGKPTLLMSLAAHSVPFKNVAQLIGSLYKEFFGDWNIVDLSTVELKGRRLDNLLGLMDAADCLITVDTSTLHLAAATNIPVVTLVGPDPWVRSCRRANHFVRLTYGQYNEETQPLVFNAIRKSVEEFQGRIHHVYPTWKMNEADKARFDQAEPTWNKVDKSAANWDHYGIDYNLRLPRTSKTALGDERSVPFVKDMVEYAFKFGAEAVVLTNSDVGFPAGVNVQKIIRRALARQGAAYCWRFNFTKINQGESPTYQDVVSGFHCGGLDCFAFTKTWWDEHKNKLPDVVMGCTDWDLIYRDKVRMLGGAELYGLNWHQLHASYWQLPQKNVGNDHNRALAQAHWKVNDSNRPFKHLREFL